MLIVLFFSNCRANPKPEDPIDISRIYCDCLNEKLINAKDSSVDINECNFLFSKSRFMRIHLQNDKSEYNKSTLDSASHFFHQVSEILDTMCFNKIDPKKIKRMPHVSM